MEQATQQSAMNINSPRISDLIVLLMSTCGPWAHSVGGLLGGDESKPRGFVLWSASACYLWALDWLLLHCTFNGHFLGFWEENGHLFILRCPRTSVLYNPGPRHGHVNGLWGEIQRPFLCSAAHCRTLRRSWTGVPSASPIQAKHTCPFSGWVGMGAAAVD